MTTHKQSIYMRIRILICFSILSIINSFQAMEIIKKIKNPSSAKNKNTSIIIKEFFATAQFREQTDETLLENTNQKTLTLPEDIIILIRQYIILLETKDLTTNKIFI